MNIINDDRKYVCFNIFIDKKNRMYNKKRMCSSLVFNY